jgi:hypothetical protein
MKTWHIIALVVGLGAVYLLFVRRRVYVAPTVLAPERGANSIGGSNADRVQETIEHAGDSLIKELFQPKVQ